MWEALRRGQAKVRSALLTLAAALGALCLVATVIAPLIEVRPLIFLSGSMSPTIPAGSLAFARTVDAADIEVGDIVTVSSNGTYLTHRVVDVTHAPGKATLLLQGDGNEVADDAVHEVTSAPRTQIWIPHVGRVVAWFSHAPGVYVLAVWVALVLGTLRRDRGATPSPKPPRARGGRPKLALATVRLLTRLRSQSLARGPQLARGAMVTAVFIATPVVAPSPALALWGDPVEGAATSVGMVLPAAPVASCGKSSGSSVRVDWTSRTAATGYRVTHGDSGSLVTEDVSPMTLGMTLDAPADGRLVVRTLYANSWTSGPSREIRYDTTGQDTCS